MKQIFLIPFFAFTLLSFNGLLCKTIDINASTFPSQGSKKDVFELSETFSNLKSINIETEKDQVSHLVLSGRFPVLRSIEITGNAIDFNGDFTGFFPVLFAIDVNFTSAKCHLDLTGTWQKDLRVTVNATSGDVFLKLPNSIGVRVRVTSTSGKISNGSLKSSLDWKILTGVKTFENELYKNAKVRMEIEVEVTSGNIYLR